MIKLLFNTNKKIAFNLNYDRVQKYFKTISNNYNFVITRHLRHTFATKCIEKGINIKQVNKLLGHTSITITNRIYTHINEDCEEEQIKLLND